MKPNKLFSFIKPWRFLIFSVILSFIAVIGVVQGLNIVSEHDLSNHMIFLCLFGLLCPMFYRLCKNINIRTTVFSILLSFIYSAILIIGAQLDQYGDIFWTWFTVLKVLCLTVFLFLLVYHAMNYVVSYQSKAKEMKQTKKQKLVLFIIIFLVNTLGFLAVFPGIYGYDSGYQILQFMSNDITVSSSFSVLYSFVLSGVVQLGYQLFHNYVVGFAVFIFLQMTLVTYVEYRISSYIYQKSNNKLLLALSILFFTLLPVNVLMKVSASQDVLFAALFGLIVLNTIEMLDDKDLFWSNITKPIKYALLLLLLAISRNNGIYIILFAFLWAVILLKQFRIKTTILFLVPCCCYFIYSNVLLPGMGVVKGNSLREMLSVPAQQIGRVYNYNPSVLSPKEKESIENLFEGDLSIYRLIPSISDSMKGMLNTDELKENFSSYALGYLRIGIKDPKNYIEAFLMNNIGFWYPNKTYPDSRMYHPYIEFNPNVRAFNENYVEIPRSNYLKPYYVVLRELVEENHFQQIPVLSNIMQMGTYFMFLLFVLAVLLYEKRYQLLVSMSFVIGLYLTLLLSPVAIFRYFYPIMMTIPLFLMLLFKRENVYRK